MLFGQVDRKSGTVKQRAWTEGISPLWCFPTGNVLSKEWPSNMMSTRQSTWLTWLERWGRGGEKKIRATFGRWTYSKRWPRSISKSFLFIFWKKRCLSLEALFCLTHFCCVHFNGWCLDGSDPGGLAKHRIGLGLGAHGGLAMPIYYTCNTDLRWFECICICTMALYLYEYWHVYNRKHTWAACIYNFTLS